MPVLVAVVDAEWRMVAANDMWIEAIERNAFGARLAAGCSYKAFCEWRQLAGSSMAIAVLSGIRGIEDGRLKHFSHRSTGNEGTIELSIMPFEIGGQRYATISYLDGAAQNETPSEKVLLAEENERQRLTRELHDGASQYLTGLNLTLAHLRQVNTDPAVAAIAEDLTSIVDEFHRDLKALTYVRHPPDLERFGLFTAMRMLCSGYAKRSGIQLSLRIHGDEPRCGSAAAAVYRIAQEALSNAVRHAKPQHIQVRLSNRPDALALIVEDDGLGLEADTEILLNEGAVGVGIPGMIARVAEFGGRLVIRSRRQKSGTILGTRIPQISVHTDASDKIIPLKRVAGVLQPALSYATSKTPGQACTMLLRTA